MKEHPILFSAPMIRAILTGRKTVTRRMSARWDRVQPSDRLWVRETFFVDHFMFLAGGLPKFRPLSGSVYYRADGECCEQIPECSCAEVGRVRWRPSIHMPRWASRLTLEVVSMRVERLQDIDEADAQREGFERREHFAALWDEINPEAPFDSDPTVRRIEFRVLP